MAAIMDGVRLAVIGGDDRECYLIPGLLELGAYIVGVGFEKAPPIPGLVLATSVLEAVSQVDVLIFPMYGTDEQGKVKTKYSDSPIVLNKEVLQAVPGQAPIFIGWARPALKSAAERIGIRIIETANLDEVCILNSIPSAEGAIQLAMDNTVITIHGSDSYVLGLGRFGRSLARMLQGIGARVTGVARKPEDLARAEEMGMRALHFSDLEEEIGKAEIIFNTVPAPILDRSLLDRLQPETVIIDLASIPGGTDFEYAGMLGIKALLAPGLPGIVAPKSAGKMLAKVYPKLILQQLINKKP